ncbi:hypothetical protein EV182_002155, partial [Spiromyces aspiralis]
MGYGDPERMTPYRCAEYIEEAFHETPVHCHVEKDLETIKHKYPLLYHSSRASLD